jgi:hypothetical protein
MCAATSLLACDTFKDQRAFWKFEFAADDADIADLIAAFDFDRL